MDALMALSEKQLAERYRESGLNSFCTPVGPVSDLLSTKPATTPAVPRNTPRNAPCPCKSGAKYKKCGGGPAAQALNTAA